MATVYSLICWGGGFGKPVGVSVGSPCYVTYTNPVNGSSHGLQNGTPVVFSDNGDSLPTGLTFGTTYYTRSNYVNEVFLYTTKAAAISGNNSYRIDTTGAQSGTHMLKSKEMLDLVTSYPDRWGVRVFDSMATWNSGRAGASNYDTEVCEIGMAFDDYIFWSSGLVITVPSLSILITSNIDGARTGGFHYGSLSRGYRLVSNYDYGGNLLVLRNYRCKISGFTVKSVQAPLNVLTMGVGTVAEKMILSGPGSSGIGIKTNVFSENYYCIAYGCSDGIYSPYDTTGSVVANCIATQNTNGFNSSSSGVSGFWYSNISIGNTATDWRQGVDLHGIADNNAGLSTEAWASSGNARRTIATSDFVNSTNDFRPAAYNSPQVDTGIAYYGAPNTDISDAEVPNYNNGGSETGDIGPYEFDHGYGPHPASHVLTLTNVVTGSRVHVSDQSGTVVHYDDIAAASTVVITQTVYGDPRDNWRIRVRKASDSPAYQPYETLMTATAGSSSIYVSQIQDE